MYGIGEKILYGSTGVMEIVDIREESIGDLPRKYYILREVNSNSSSHTYVPVDNERLVGCMYPLLTKEEVMDIISRAKIIPEVEWHTNNRVRAEKFRSIIESGDREGLISLIRTVYENGLRLKDEGRKNYITDENLMRKAEKLICSEFSEVLGIPENEVREFIANHC